MPRPLPAGISFGPAAPSSPSGDLRARARQYAEQEGIDPDLFELQIAQESAFDPNAVSSAGAQGLGQLMPGTAGDLGVTDPFDVDQNLRGSARYFRQQMDRFKDPKLALAAYNAGPGNVEKYGGVPPFEETQNYVNSIYGKWTQQADAADIASKAAGAPRRPPPTAIPESYEDRGEMRAGPKTSWFDEYIANPAKRGAARAKGGIRTLLTPPEVEPERWAAGMARLQRQYEAAAMNEDNALAMQKIAEANGYLEAGELILDNPGAIFQTVVESLSTYTPGLTATALLSSLGPLGTAAGAGTGSFLVEYTSTIMDTIAEKGGDPMDPRTWAQAITDPEFVAAARQKGVERGLIIGAFDAISGGLAGKLLAGTKGFTSGVARGAGEIGLQAGSGAGGEYAASMYTEGEARPGDVLIEAAAEAPTAAIEVPANIASAREAMRANQQKTADQLAYDKNQLRTVLESGTDEDLNIELDYLTAKYGAAKAEAFVDEILGYTAESAAVETATAGAPPSAEDLSAQAAAEVARPAEAIPTDPVAAARQEEINRVMGPETTVGVTTAPNVELPEVSAAGMEATTALAPEGDPLGTQMLKNMIAQLEDMKDGASPEERVRIDAAIGEAVQKLVEVERATGKDTPPAQPFTAPPAAPELEITEQSRYRTPTVQPTRPEVFDGVRMAFEETTGRYWDDRDEITGGPPRTATQNQLMDADDFWVAMVEQYLPMLRDAGYSPDQLKPINKALSIAARAKPTMANVKKRNREPITGRAKGGRNSLRQFGANSKKSVEVEVDGSRAGGWGRLIQKFYTQIDAALAELAQQQPQLPPRGVSAKAQPTLVPEVEAARAEIVGYDKPKTEVDQTTAQARETVGTDGTVIKQELVDATSPPPAPNQVDRPVDEALAARVEGQEAPAVGPSGTITEGADDLRNQLLGYKRGERDPVYIDRTPDDPLIGELAAQFGLKTVPAAGGVYLMSEKDSKNPRIQRLIAKEHEAVAKPTTTPVAMENVDNVVVAPAEKKLKNGQAPISGSKVYGVDENGQEISIRADKALANADARVNNLKQLMECLKK